MGRGRHPSSLASFGPDRSDYLHVYRWPVSHHPAHKTRALDRYDPEFREQAEDLFERVKDRVGEKRAVRLTGSYSMAGGSPQPGTVASADSSVSVHRHR